MSNKTYLSDDDRDELIGPVCLLADMATSRETPGVAIDEEMDLLIYAARRVQAREGFKVVKMKL